jgi:hypothetical protein
MTAGRPLKYDDPDKVSRLINKYFRECDKQDIPYTVNGLALAIGLHRATLLDYEQNDRGRPEEQETRQKISDLIKDAKAKVESSLENRLLAGKCAPAGPIFILKNMGWKDKTELEGNMTVSFVEHLAEIDKRRNEREGETE